MPACGSRLTCRSSAVISTTGPDGHDSVQVAPRPSAGVQHLAQRISPGQQQNQPQRQRHEHETPGQLRPQDVRRGRTVPLDARLNSSDPIPR